MRKSVLFAVLALAAVLAAGLVLLRSERSASAQGLTLDRSQLALLPPDATSLLGVDIEGLKGTPLYRHIEEESRKNGRSHFDDFARETGFDPRRDVESLLAASWGGVGDGQFLAVARGRFNVSALSGQIRTHQAIAETYRGFEVFGPEKQQDGRQQGRFVFLDDRTALIGARPALLAAIDRKLGGGPSLLNNTDLLSRAHTISGSHQVWAVSDNPGLLVPKALPRDSSEASSFARIFSSMQNSTFALDLRNGLDVRAASICKTPQDAKTLADAARGVVAFGRLAVSQKEPEMMTLFDGVQVEERNTALDITIRVDTQSFEKLLQRGRLRQGRKSAQVE